MGLTCPNIFDHKNIIDYLVAYFQYEKSLNESFSIRKWSKTLDIDSRNFVSILQQKKKITPVQSQKFMNGLNLDDSEQVYFEALVKLTYAEVEREKQVLEIILSELRMHTGSVAYVEDDSVFSHWSHMAILSMSRITGFECNRNTIKEFLLSDVPEEVVDDSIERLLRLNLIKIGDNGAISKDFDNITSKNDVYKKSPHLYYEQVSNLAKKAIEVSLDEREFQCFSLAIKYDKLPAFKEMIRNFRAKICAFAESDNTDQAYQMNIQFFPLTKKVEGVSVQTGKQMDASFN